MINARMIYGNIPGNAPDNVAKTNEMSRNLKKELGENRKSYSDLMSKIENLVVKENKEYRKKLKENQSKKINITAPVISLEEVKNYQNSHSANDIINELLIGKVEVLNDKKKEVVNKQINEASSNIKKPRSVEDKLALVRLEKYKTEAIEKQKKSTKAQEKKASVSLPKVLEFLRKNPDFYKDEITTMTEIKNLKDVTDGFYIVANNFVDAEQRDLFIKKLYDNGEFNAGFFFDTNTSSYVVYLEQFNSFNNFTR